MFISPDQAAAGALREFGVLLDDSAAARAAAQLSKVDRAVVVSGRDVMTGLRVQASIRRRDVLGEGDLGPTAAG